MSALRLQDVHRRFRSGDALVEALQGVSLQVDAGESVAVLGPSGSGKSTLLGLVAGLEHPDEGTVWIADTRLADLDEDGLADLRARAIGVVFQQFRLLPDLSALENVLLPLELSGVGTATERRRRATQWLERVDLGPRLQHRPAQLSGGEQQRVAIARALVIGPTVVVADEPTGSLDTATGALVADLLFDLVHEQGLALLVVTHDEQLARRTRRTLRLVAGRIDAPAAG